MEKRKEEFIIFTLGLASVMPLLFAGIPYLYNFRNITPPPIFLENTLLIVWLGGIVLAIITTILGVGHLIRNKDRIGRKVISGTICGILMLALSLLYLWALNTWA